MSTPYGGEAQPSAAEVPGTVPPSAPSAPVSPPPPETGDLVIDASLRDLSGADPSDLDAVISIGDQVHSTLRARLADLGD